MFSFLCSREGQVAHALRIFNKDAIELGDKTFAESRIAAVVYVLNTADFGLECCWPKSAMTVLPTKVR